MGEVTFDRPTPAKLIIRCENGDEWEATEEDVRKFGYIDVSDAMHNFRVQLRMLLGEPENRLDEGDISMLRYLVDRTVYHYGHEGLQDFTCSDDDETIAEMRRWLSKLDGWAGWPKPLALKED